MTGHHQARLLQAALCASLALPGAAHAQTSAMLGGFLSGSTVDGVSNFVGVTAGTAAGLLGFRFSAGMDAAGTPAGSVVASGEAANSGAWSADADVSLGQHDGRPLSFQPAAFVGLGLRGVPQPTLATPGDAAVVPVWHWGARLAMPLASWIALEGEARHRSALEQAERTRADGWEWRAGLALTFRAARMRGRTVRPAPAPAPARRAAPPAAAPIATASAPLGQPTGSADVSADVLSILGDGEDLLGVGYTWGGSSPSLGFDCSGFVQYVYRRHGVELPRTSRQQALSGEPLPLARDALAPGDLLFFAGDGRTISHVAIYAGEGRILHSSRSGQGVRYDELDSPRGAWYRRSMVAARRVVDTGAAGADVRGLPQLPLDEAFEALMEEEIGDQAAAG